MVVVPPLPGLRMIHRSTGGLRPRLLYAVPPGLTLLVPSGLKFPGTFDAIIGAQTVPCPSVFGVLAGGCFECPPFSHRFRGGGHRGFRYTAKGADLGKMRPRKIPHCPIFQKRVN